MKKVLKWIGIGLAGLVGIVILIAVGLSFVGGARLKQTQAIQAETIPIPTDEAALARGRHLAHVGCESCHGEELTGQDLVGDSTIGAIYAANITGLSETHTDADLVRAIRHAVDTDGRQLMIMPAEVFIHFSAEDLGAIIAYLKTVPAAGAETPQPQLALLGRVLLGAGMFGDIFPAAYIDHNQPFQEMPSIGANIEYGQYLSGFCRSCHGADLTGRQPADPTSPPAPDLTQAGRVSLYTEDTFIQTIRTGVTPYNYTLDGDYMPWESFARFEDEELRGLWMYLESLPGKQAVGER